MIERLNFYDVYGYLLPGLVLAVVGWFPFWFVADTKLPADWSSALVGLALCYILGHLIQRLARAPFPQERPDKGGRLPSDYLLDPHDTGISLDVKKPLAELIYRKFLIEVETEDGFEATLRQRRSDAFRLCRSVLIQQEASSYAEQFQGMYVLMRGLAAVAILSAVYHTGWAAGRFASPVLAGIAGDLLFVLVVAAGILRYQSDGPRVFGLITGACFPLGLLLGYRFGPGPYLNPETVLMLVGVGFGSLFAARQFCGAYLYFGEEFTATVYRDFYALMRSTPAKAA